jgi:hypothetical protein
MSSSSDAGSLPVDRGRRIVIALPIFLLILLPLYLWPLRSGLGALPWTATLTARPQKDPRDPAALAAIPSAVWEALLNEGSGSAHGSAGSPKGLAPQNLTMIAPPEAGNGPGILEPGSADSLSGSGLLTNVIGPTEGKSGDAAPSPSSTAGSSTAEPFDSWLLAGGGQGNAGPWPSGGGGGVGGSRGLPTALGTPFGGDAPSVGPPVELVLSPGDPVAPHPAPEPGTVALVGLLLASVAWNHRRYKEARARIR